MSNKISRRTFLKCTGASAAALGAAVMLGGCGGSGSNAIEVKVGDKVSSWNNLGVQLTSVFSLATAPDVEGFEYIAVLVTAVNRSGSATFNIGAQNIAELSAKYPMEDEATKIDEARAYFHELAASTSDFVVVCDGVEREAGVYVSLYNADTQTFSDSNCLPPNGSGYIELMCCVPKGWQHIDVTFTPTFLVDKSITFTINSSDLTQA